MKQLCFLLTLHIILMQGEPCKLRHRSKLEDIKDLKQPENSTFKEIEEGEIVTTEEENEFDLLNVGLSQTLEDIGKVTRKQLLPMLKSEDKRITSQTKPTSIPLILNHQETKNEYTLKSPNEELITGKFKPQLSTSQVRLHIEQDVTTKYPTTTSQDKNVTDVSKSKYSTIAITLNDFHIVENKTTTNSGTTETSKEDLVGATEAKAQYPMDTITESIINDDDLDTTPKYTTIITTLAEERVSDQYKPQISGSLALLPDINNKLNTTTDYPASTSTIERVTADDDTKIIVQGFNISAAIGRFGLNILQIASKRTNLVLSPYSITTSLALLQQGASGETLQQISSALQVPANDTATVYKQLTSALRERNSGNNILNVANNVFIADRFELKQDFKNKAVDNFGSEVSSLDFADSVRAAQAINKWVSNATNNKINQLVASDSVSQDTQLVLVNTLLFKGVWQTKFRPSATLPGEFYINAEENKTIPFMRARKYFKYGEDINLQVIVLPFENYEYSLVVILPSEMSSVTEVLQNLTYDKLAAYQNFEEEDVDLELPKFSIRSDTDLHPLLKAMGVEKMFGAPSDLNEIGNGGNNAPQVSSAIHSALLSIDEQGGTAYAATAFSVIALSFESPDAVFSANRPFLAIVWDTKEALPLIMARIDDPTL